MSKHEEGKLDTATVKQISNFLFQDPKRDSDFFLDTRTDVQGRETFTALMFYRILAEHFSCKAADRIANIIERLNISRNRLGREEGVTILQQGLPKGSKILIGADQILKGEEIE